MTKTFHSSSAVQTQQIAAELAATLRGGEVIALLGDLGAGKTTFTQGLVAALGSTARVKSPTFAVMHEYQIENHATIHRVAHLDLYRFTDPSELRALELDSYKRPDTVMLVEWPNIFGEEVITADIVVELKGNTDPDVREIVITTSVGGHGA